jgi:nucleotide-binding universal stress UspA family protein
MCLAGLAGYWWRSRLTRYQHRALALAWNAARATGIADSTGLFCEGGGRSQQPRIKRAVLDACAPEDIVEIRDILVLVEPDAQVAGPYALSLAALLGAHVTAAAFAEKRAMASPFSELPTSLLEAMYEDSVQAAERALRDFTAGAEQPNVTTELVTVEPGETVAGCFRWLARHFDLSVAQQPAPDHPVNEHAIEAGLFGSGRPIILVPYVHSRPARLDTILIAWNESAIAARAVGDALPLLEKADRVELVMVADSSGSGSAARMIQHLARHNIQAPRHTMPAAGGVGEALLSYAADIDADLVVMGGYGHSRLREMILGGTTRTMLASMTIPVLMAH